MITITKNPRIDYDQLAAKLNYAALGQKLEHLREEEPKKTEANR